MRGEAVRSARGVVVLAGFVAALAACGGEGGELRDATRAREASQAADTGVAAADTGAPSAMPVDTAYDVPAFATPGSPAAGADSAKADTIPARRDSAAAPAPVPVPTPAPTPDAPAASRDWTAGTRQVRRTASPPSIVTDVRTARNDGFDRVVLTIQGARVPGYRVEYVDRPVRMCGSGEATQIAGDAWLSIRLDGAAAHDDRGNATVQPRERRLSLPVMRELEMTCDFEGEVTVVVGAARPNKYRVLELANPTRLVVDVQH